jgi:hypothetical protein
MKDATGRVSPAEQLIVSEILTAIRGIEFGSVLVKIHHGEVVGIETSTKVRLKGSEKTG